MEVHETPVLGVSLELRTSSPSHSAEMSLYSNPLGHRGGSGNGTPQDPFVRFMVATVRCFVQTVDTADFRNRQQFQNAVSFLAQIGIPESELASIFGTTANAISRWVNGKSAPTPILRPMVVQAALEILKRDGFKIGGHRYDAVSGECLDAPAARQAPRAA